MCLLEGYGTSEAIDVKSSIDIHNLTELQSVTYLAYNFLP